MPEVTKFLQKHGPKILKFATEYHDLPIFDLCPNMAQLTLTVPRFYVRHMHPTRSHSNIFILSMVRNMGCHVPETSIGTYPKSYLVWIMRVASGYFIFLLSGLCWSDFTSQLFPPSNPNLITGVDYSFFPALQEIQVCSIQWPATEWAVLWTLMDLLFEIL